MTALTRVMAKAPADVAGSFVPQHNSLAGRHPGLAPSHNFETRPAGLVSQPPLLQAKLAIGEPDDEYEREADRVSETVMRMPEPVVQRKTG